MKKRDQNYIYLVNKIAVQDLSDDYEKRILDEVQDVKSRIIYEERSKFKESMASLNKTYYEKLETLTKKIAVGESQVMEYEQQILILRRDLEAFKLNADSKENILKLFLLDLYTVELSYQ